MKDNVVVSVCMITYNHESYIKQAIEGVLMQKCTYPIELVVGEDFSSDNTKQICASYAKDHQQIRLLQRKSNLGMLDNFFSTLHACKGKYIAICEGDDFWIDPYKLQKQVDFLEQNPDYSLVHTKSSIYNEIKGNYEKKTLGSLLSGNDFLISNPVATLTSVFRKGSFESYIKEIDPQNRNWKMGDYPLWLWINFNSKIHFIPEITAVYRVQQGSASRPLDNDKRYQYRVSTFEIANTFALKHCNTSEYDRFLGDRYIFLYLYCVKHNINKEHEYINKINCLERKTMKVKMILFVFFKLQLSNLYHLVFHRNVARKSFNKD